MQRFAGRVALVTGAGSGIGRATALRLASEGAAVAVADNNRQAAETVVHEIEQVDGAAIAIRADVRQESECKDMLERAGEWKGQLDIVVPNAGIGGGDLVEELAVAGWDDVIATNLRGVFLTCKFAIPWLVKSASGAIVTISSSMAGWDTSPTGAAYMASKEGVTGLTRSLALQLGRRGVRANSVCPGVIRTKLGVTPETTGESIDRKYEQFARRIPLGRVGRPEDVAATVAFLASDDAAHISGSLLLIDGGQTLQSWSNAPHAETYPERGAW